MVCGPVEQIEHDVTVGAGYDLVLTTTPRNYPTSRRPKLNNIRSRT